MTRPVRFPRSPWLLAGLAAVVLVAAGVGLRGGSAGRAPLGPPPSDAPRPAADPKDGRLEKWSELAFEAGVEEIRFHGRVVDQLGRPLPGATIHYEAAGRFLSKGSGMGTVTSDAGGRFLIEARGDSLTVHNIRHPDAMYVALPEAAARAGSNRMYATGNTFWSYTRRVGGDNLIWSDSPADPIVFDLWLVDRDEARMHEGEILWRSDYFALPPDGAEHTLVLGDRGTPFEVIEGRRDEGDLVVRCRAEAMSGHGDRGAWSVTLAPVDGGIQATDDRYLNLAPASGYRASVEVGSPAPVDGEGVNLFGRRFYFSAQEGQRVGALFMDFEPFNLPFNLRTREYGEQYCRIRIEYKVNTAGSRYLFENRRLLPEADDR